MLLLILLRIRLFLNYVRNDKAHQWNHVQHNLKVAKQLCSYAKLSKRNILLVKVAIYCHDMMVYKGRKEHHNLAADWVKQSWLLSIFFKSYEIPIIERSIREHRASYKGSYSEIHGQIVSGADRSDLDFNNLYTRLLRTTKGSTDTDRDTNVLIHMCIKWGRHGYARFPKIFRQCFAKELEALHVDIDTHCAEVFSDELHIEVLDKKTYMLLRVLYRYYEGVDNEPLREVLYRILTDTTATFIDAPELHQGIEYHTENTYIQPKNTFTDLVFGEYTKEPSSVARLIRIDDTDIPSIYLRLFVHKHTIRFQISGIGFSTMIGYLRDVGIDTVLRIDGLPRHHITKVLQDIRQIKDMSKDTAYPYVDYIM